MESALKRDFQKDEKAALLEGENISYIPMFQRPNYDE